MKIKIFVLLFVFTFTNFIFSQWTQQGTKLVGVSTYQGSSVSISSDGNTAIVGAPGGTGAVLVYTRSGNNWSFQGSLVGTGSVGNSQQGNSVAISSDGNTLVFGGAYDNNDNGAIWVFTRTGTVWLQQGPKLVGTGGLSLPRQGWSVSISSDGNTIIEGGNFDNAFTGAAWIFTRSGNTWSQQGQKLVGTGSVGETQQGCSVAISSDGNTAIIGGFRDNNSTGALWIFTRTNNIWSQQGPKLIGSGATGNAFQGFSVSISSDGNTVLSGGISDNNNKGAVWVFTKTGSIWTQQGSKLAGIGTFGNTYQGCSTAISSNGNLAVIGGYGDYANFGAIWVFIRSGGIWSQSGPKLYGSDATGNMSNQGYSVAVSSEGNTIIEGGPFDNSNVGASWVFYNPLIGIQPISTEIPKQFSLLQNYPNPFNPTTKIRFEVPLTKGDLGGFVGLNVYNALGQQITTLVTEQLKPGSYEVEFNAADYPSGVYFYNLTAADFSQTKKMVLIK